jgi:hypothetical protein
MLSTIQSDDGRLLAAAADWLASRDELNVDLLSRLAAEQGIDFATAVAYHHVCNSPKHGEFIRRIEAMDDSEASSLCPPGFRVAIVPGAFYREHPHTGANGRLLVEELSRLGYAVEVLPLASFGRLADGAAQLRQWLSRQNGQPLVLVALSKGGSEVKLALAQGHDAFKNVIAWIDLSGILEGTALVDWLYRHPFRYLVARCILWWRNYPATGLEDLRRGTQTPLAAPLELPEWLTAIHVVGFPLKAYLCCPWAERAHARLEPLGPNDGGGILLGDAIARAGLVYPVWGADHYLRPAWDIRRLVARFVRFVEEEALCRTAARA